MSSRIVFMGTPDFAVPTLRVLSERIPRQHLLVVTQPDRASGRGRRLQAPPVKQHAVDYGLDVVQVETLKDSSIRERITTFQPDLIIVAAFGLVLSRWVLELPTYGCINLHASLLPRFRGASPIPAAIACGDETTGVAIMQMERGLDTGGIYATHDEIIRASDTTATLTARLAETSGGLLKDQLRDLSRGAVTPVPQLGKIVETRKIVKAHGSIDWAWSAERVERHVRAMWPWPRAWTVSGDGNTVQVHKASVEANAANEQPGVVLHAEDRILVATGDRWLRLDTIQLPGKQAQPSRNLLQHPAFSAGARFDRGENFERPDPWIVETGHTN